MIERIGVFIWMIILIIWYKISGKMSRWLRYFLALIVIAAELILAVILMKVWKLNLIFGLVISGCFFLSEYFPRSGRRMREITQMRRINISVWEDYFFVAGVTMLGIDFYFLLVLKNIL